MKIRLSLVLIVVMTFVVRPVLGEGPAQQTTCNQVTVDIPVSSSRDTNIGGIDAYLVVSSQGCPLPHLYCIWESHGNGAGISCNPISDDVVNQLVSR